MARVFMSGFESGVYQNENWELYSGGTATSSLWNAGRPYGYHLVGTQGPAGGHQDVRGEYAVWLYDNVSYPQALRNTLDSPLTECYGRFAYNTLSGGRRTNQRIWEWHLNGVGLIAQLVEYDRGGYYGIRLANAAGSIVAENQNWIFNGNISEWYLVEWYIKLAGSGGRCTVWVNDVLYIDYSGPLAGPGGETIFDQVIIGGGGSTLTTGSRQRGYDDIAINDVSGAVNNGRLGDGVILPRWPNGAGASSQLTNDLGTSVGNYKRVWRRTDQQPDPSGFVGTSTAGQKDTYRIQALPRVRGGVGAVMLQAKAIRNGPAISNLRYSYTPQGSSEILAPAAPGIALPTDGLTWLRQIVDNDGGEPLSYDGVDAAQAGFSMEA